VAGLDPAIHVVKPAFIPGGFVLVAPRGYAGQARA
jgi:hypothetical protein